jgi:hypothetical protein
MRRSMLLVLIATAAACSSAEMPRPETPSADYHFAFDTEPGEEKYWCQYVQVPTSNSGDINVTGFRWKTENYHHWSLFRTRGLGADAVTGKPFECFGSPETDAAMPLSIVSQPTTDTTEILYPDEYALPFSSGEVLMLQAHTINASPSPSRSELDLHVLLAGDAAPVKPLGEFQFYNPFIHIPGRGEGHASMRCPVPQDIDIVWAETHQHTRGTGFDVFLDPPDGPPATEPLLSAGSWEHPATRLDPLHVPAGSTFRIFCDYADTSGEDTYQGPTKLHDEMCQFYGFYSAPFADPAAALNFEGCVPSFVPGAAGDMHGTGEATCADTLACIAGCPAGDAPRIEDGKFIVGECWQRCVVSSCPSAETQLNPVLACSTTKCATECAGGAADPGCQACLGTSCAAELTSCQTAACTAP